MSATRSSARIGTRPTDGAGWFNQKLTRRTSQPRTSPTSPKATSAPGLVVLTRPLGCSGGRSSWSSSGGRSRVTGASQVEREILALDDALVAHLLEELDDRTEVGDLGVRLHVVPGGEDEGALVRLGVREDQLLVVRTAV